MSHFVKLSDADRIAKYDIGADVSKIPLCYSSDFPLDYSDPDKHLFNCWFVDKNDGLIHNSNLCVSMANPESGDFILYDVKKIDIPYKTINMCIVETYSASDMSILKSDRIKYYGLRERPYFCRTRNDSIIKRIMVKLAINESDAIEIESDKDKDDSDKSSNPSLDALTKMLQNMRFG